MSEKRKPCCECCDAWIETEERLRKELVALREILGKYTDKLAEERATIAELREALEELLAIINIDPDSLPIPKAVIDMGYEALAATEMK